MTILIAPDSLKDALPAGAVAASISNGIAASRLQADCLSVPLADGGEGTTAVLAKSLGGELRRYTCLDALGRPHQAQVLWTSADAAFLTLADVVGIEQLGLQERKPERTSTYGLGQLIRQLILEGASAITLAIGGSCTQDLGLGLLRGLGYSLHDAIGEALEGTGADLARVESIVAEDESAFTAAFAKTQFTVLCDVNNPLFGDRGTAHTYARQKGADDEMIARLESSGRRAFGKMLASSERFKMDTASGNALQHLPGIGAAGGVATALLVFANCTLSPGAEYILQRSGLLEALKSAALLITAEGRLDAQSVQGKLVSALVQAAKAHEVPVVVLCGALDLSPAQLQDHGIAAAFPIGARPQVLAKALPTTSDDLCRTATMIGNLLALNFPGGKM